MGKLKRNIKSLFSLTILFILNLSYFTSSNFFLANNNYSSANLAIPLELNPSINVVEEPSFVSSFSFSFDSINNLYLIYNEQQVNHNKLIYKEADSDYQWNLTEQIIVEDNNSLSIFGTPSIEVTADKLWFVIPYENSSSQGVILYSKGLSSNKWHSNIILSKEATSISSPLIQKIPEKDALLFTWKDNHEGNFNIYTMYYNITTQLLNNLSRITSNSGFYISNIKFTFDSNNDIHFVWSEGETNYEQILYRKIYQNGTMEPIEFLTDGSNRCKYPTIINDGQGSINVFWTNYTKINPGIDYGTININTVKKYSQGNWSKILDIAPYIPLERPPGSESDAEKPTVALDIDNNLWLAYEIREQYVNHIGVDIRHRSNFGWQNGEKVSLVINSAIDPLIKADNAGNLHCMWLDIRYGSYDIIYRIKFITGLWSYEIALSHSSTNAGSTLARNMGIIIAVIVAFSIPIFLLNRMKVRRLHKKMQKKIDDLND